MTDGRKKYLYGGCGWERSTSQLLLIIKLAVAAGGPHRHKPGKVSISPDRFSLQPVAVAISYTFSQRTRSPSQPPPGSVLGSPRRIAAEESDQWWEPALKEVGQQIGWGGRTGGGR